MPPPDAQRDPARRPAPARPGRMDRLATLPLFFPLDGRRVVVAGGSEAAAWKAELLSAAGAIVEVLAADPCPELEALCADPPGGPVVLDRSPWSAHRFAGAALVVAAAEDETDARRIYDAACASGVPVNVIDRPEHCTFQFGAIVNRSPLVIGISTSGAAPIFAQAIRSRIEALLPAGFRRWMLAAQRWRADLGKRGLSPADRRRFWERFTDLALNRPDRNPDELDFATLREPRAAPGGGPSASAGCVTLVGAGPGDPELLTLKAVRALRSADVILFDDLVAPGILDFARREARRMLVGKTGHRPSCRQDDINALMTGLAKSGRRVVRLKSGDPMIFGRACEEIAALERAGIAYDIVPGVTAAQGAAASLRQPLTSRGGARRVQLITGHAHTGRLPDDLDLAALADPCVTTAVYMPLATLAPFVDRLRAAGVDEAREICAVFSATRPDEHIVRASLGSICAQVGALGGSGPCLVLVSASGPAGSERRAPAGPPANAPSDDPRSGQPPAAAAAR